MVSNGSEVVTSAAVVSAGVVISSSSDSVVCNIVVGSGVVST